MDKKGKHPGGRPLKFKTVKELQELIEKYFRDCKRQKRPYTITGLAIALDTTRDVLLDYENVYPQYSNTVKKAKQKCENFAEEKLFGNTQVAGAIFNLKNNYKNWKDRSELEITENEPDEDELRDIVEGIISGPKKKSPRRR